jgi:hypothetical protein
MDAAIERREIAAACAERYVVYAKFSLRLHTSANRIYSTWKRTPERTPWKQPEAS